MGKWTKCANMHISHAKSKAVVLQNNIFVIGGKTCTGHGHNNGWYKTPIVEMYDPKNDTWKIMASLNYARNNRVNAFVQNDNRIVCLGERSIFSHIKAEIYDPYQNKWSILESDEFDDAIVTTCDRKLFNI